MLAEMMTPPIIADYSTVVEEQLLPQVCRKHLSTQRRSNFHVMLTRLMQRRSNFCTVMLLLDAKEEQFLHHCAELLPDAKEEQFLHCRADLLLDVKEEQFLHCRAVLHDAKEEQFLCCHAVLQEQLKDLLRP